MRCDFVFGVYMDPGRRFARSVGVRVWRRQQGSVRFGVAIWLAVQVCVLGELSGPNLSRVHGTIRIRGFQGAARGSIQATLLFGDVSLLFNLCTSRVVQRPEFQQVVRNQYIKPQQAYLPVRDSDGGVVVIVQVALVVLGSCVQPRCGCQCGDHASV